MVVEGWVGLESPAALYRNGGVEGCIMGWCGGVPFFLIPVDGGGVESSHATPYLSGGVEKCVSSSPAATHLSC